MALSQHYVSAENLTVFINVNKLSVINFSGRDPSNGILFAECVFSYLVTVLVPPSIAPGPTNITVTVNVQTTLACEATGIPKPSINWRKNGHLLNVDQNQNSYR